jgi:hypothetical protein
VKQLTLISEWSVADAEKIPSGFSENGVRYNVANNNRRRPPPQTKKEQIMKALNHFLLTATVVALLGIANATAAESQAVTMQYGQGGPVTFFKPSARKTTAEYGHAVKQGSATVRWMQQSIPNGPAISYVVQEHTRFDIAPLK